MMYAHIFENESKFYVWYRYPFKFNSEGEEKILENKVLVTLFEETGDLVLLDKQVAEWKKIHSIEQIVGFEDFSGMSFPDKDELISMLRQEAHRTAAYLERERKEKIDLQKKHDEVLRLAGRRIFEYQTVVELLHSEIAMLQEAGPSGEELSEARETMMCNLKKIVYH